MLIFEVFFRSQVKSRQKMSKTYGQKCGFSYASTYLDPLTYMRVSGFQFFKVGGQTEKRTKKYDPSAESLVPGAVPEVGLILIA